MSEVPVSEETIGRLRANAARPGISLSDEDVARIASGMFLRNVDAFVRLVERTPPDTIPDDLKDWNDLSLAEAGSGEHSGTESVAAPAAPRDPFAPLYQVADAIAARDVSPVELTELMLERIAQHDP